MLSLEELLVHLNKYASRRSFTIKNKTKKITSQILRDEIVCARVLGELTSAEKILQAIVDNKDWDRDTIEAELHIFIAELNNICCQYLDMDRNIGVDDIIKAYGYLDKKEDESV